MTNLDYFIAGYNKAQDKEKYVGKHITKSYMKYEDKIAEANKIVDLTYYDHDVEPKVFHKNSPLQYQLFVLRVLKNYTDIEINEINAAEDFNALNRIGAIDDIFAAIPEREIKEFETVLHMVEDDIMTNERSLVGWLNGKLDALSYLLANLPQEETSEPVTSEEITTEE